jgi:hypothetical protein
MSVVFILRSSCGGVGFAGAVRLGRVSVSRGS